jgi:hypothetical protein
MTDQQTTIPSSNDSTVQAQAPETVHARGAQTVEEILAEAFKADAAQPPQSPETVATPEPGAETQPATMDLAALAERLGVEPESLYEVQFPMPDGAEPVSLGQLKDAWREGKGLEAKQTELTRARAEWQADQIRQQREIDQLLSAIDPAAIRPEQAQAVQRVNAERLSREREALLRTVPEWSDPVAVQADVLAITAHLQPYGITAADVDAITDHRLLRYFREQARQAKAKEVQAGKAKLAQPKVAPRRAPQPGAGADTKTLRAAVQSGRMSTTDAVAKILEGL